jgi:hypothetical protein
MNTQKRMSETAQREYECAKTAENLNADPQAMRELAAHILRRYRNLPQVTTDRLAGISCGVSKFYPETVAMLNNAGICL